MDCICMQMKMKACNAYQGVNGIGVTEQNQTKVRNII